MSRMTAEEFYREAGWPLGLLWEARAADVPVPFYTIEGTVRGPRGVVVDIRRTFRDPPSEGAFEETRRWARAAVGGTVIADSLCVNACYDPREFT